ncbi:VPLPA-CTERM sorting domain-containing protein [Methylomonas albis]|uniref:VPLPA-CTERM sorting domain-containing protein n=1 Tax=Methylomonas albis TaxID=1854563 RepID=A0ABR9CWN8_9GAMM|nr:VPLPA-CTERM sorting domain-containing protein [Methylomonas albis]MBD9355293.1 VPLPA-CTERM sorting domain-containing protein [Methylomonas albis]
MKFLFQSNNGFNKLILAIGLMLSLTALQAEASLTAGIADGKSVVYSSVSNLTWTGDANLLGTLMASQGYNAVVNAIIGASPTIYSTPYDTPFGSSDGQHHVSSADFFSSDGNATWYGAQAFVSYLNSINYAGSNQWALPSAGGEPHSGHIQIGTPFGDLFYSELGGGAGFNIPDTNYFTNEIRQNSVYWTDTEYVSSGIYAWDFNISGGYQVSDFKSYVAHIWAISPGNITAVPVPAAAWLFGSALAGLGAVSRRRSAGFDYE